MTDVQCPQVLLQNSFINFTMNKRQGKKLLNIVERIVKEYAWEQLRARSYKPYSLRKLYKSTMSFFSCVICSVITLRCGVFGNHISMIQEIRQVWHCCQLMEFGILRVMHGDKGCRMQPDTDDTWRAQAEDNAAL